MDTAVTAGAIPRQMYNMQKVLLHMDIWLAGSDAAQRTHWGESHPQPYVQDPQAGWIGFPPGG
jgi:hypothetical protein